MPSNIGTFSVRQEIANRRGPLPVPSVSKQEIAPAPPSVSDSSEFIPYSPGSARHHFLLQQYLARK